MNCLYTWVLPWKADEWYSLEGFPLTLELLKRLEGLSFIFLWNSTPFTSTQIKNFASSKTYSDIILKQIRYFYKKSLNPYTKSYIKRHKEKYLFCDVIHHWDILRITKCKLKSISIFMHLSDALRVLFRITKRYLKLSSSKSLIMTDNFWSRFLRSSNHNNDVRDIKTRIFQILRVILAFFKIFTVFVRLTRTLSKNCV